MRVAVIDMGTNSTRLLVADVEGGELAELDRRSTVTRLGRGVDTSRQLAMRGDRGRLRHGRRVRRRATRSSAPSGWSRSRPRRSATPRTAGAFTGELRERFALDARILDGEDEARLTYLGANHDRPARDETLVVDIGGGSTELVVGRGDDVSLSRVARRRHRPPHGATHPA